MMLIGLLLALLAERLLGHLPRLGQPMLLERLVVGVQRALPLETYWRSATAPAALLLAATALAGLIGWWLHHPVLDLIYGAVVLFLCLGPRNLANDIQRLIDARESNDTQTERTLTLSLLHGPERNASRRSLLGALFIQSHESLFGVLLWFIAAGPGGAVLYRLASRMPRFLHQSQPDTPAERAAVFLHAAVAWIPVRLCAALYGLAGSLDQAIEEFRRKISDHSGNWRERSWALLAEVSAASLSADEGAEGAEGVAIPARLEDCLREVLSMQNRALLILLAAFGLFTAGGLSL